MSHILAYAAGWQFKKLERSVLSSSTTGATLGLFISTTTSAGNCFIWHKRKSHQLYVSFAFESQMALKPFSLMEASLRTRHFFGFGLLSTVSLSQYLLFRCSSTRTRRTRRQPPGVGLRGRHIFKHIRTLSRSFEGWSHYFSYADHASGAYYSR